MPKLKPCPFCGKAPHIGYYEPVAGCWLYSIDCRWCEMSPSTDDYHNEKDAAEAWNTRAPDPLREAVLWYFEAMDVHRKVYSTPRCELDWKWHCAYGESYNTMKQAEADLRQAVSV